MLINFQTFFHYQNQERIRNYTITNRSHHTSNVSLHSPCEVSMFQSSNWKQDLCNNTF